jgi:hypothetical protein
METREQSGGSGGSPEVTVNGGIKTCGTDDTPPCPPSLVYIERTELIEQLAGPHADRRRIAEVAEQVDRYLISTLRSVRELARATQLPVPAPR